MTCAPNGGCPDILIVMCPPLRVQDVEGVVVDEGPFLDQVAQHPARLAQIADTLSQPATTGRLAQVIDRWIYTACLCFGLDLAEQQRCGFGYGYSVYQAEYSRNLLFTIGAQMDRVFDRIVDRTRSRLDVPILRTLFGAKQRPGRNGTPDLSLKLAAVIETPRYDLTLFKLHFGNLTLKAYTKGEHVLRFEAIVHNTKALRCGRVLDNFPIIIGRLASMVDRFTTTLDCVDTTFIADGLLDRLPAPAQLGATRVGGVDLNKPRIRGALAAVLALSATSDGFTVAKFTAKVHAMTGNTGYTIRQAAYDLRKLRGKQLVTKPGRTRATTSTRAPRAPSPPCSPSASTSSGPSSPGSAAPGWAANRSPGPASTATTRRSASTCKRSSSTWASAPPHRQHLVDRRFVSA